ncbi:neural cell adhesion molecule 1-like [Rhipicephalus microplus]|uniref:neural cell adhesion molecule 1-like n=1 Tax=Rhipicephalus microplus TaxID=6941 RepID=UPI003F6B8CA5
MQCPWLLFSAIMWASIATARESYSGRPVLQPFSFPHDLTSGEDATFRCVVKSGRPPYHFRWLKDDQDVSVTERLTTSVVNERVATLNVRRVTVEDSGNYTCLVSDSTGVEAAVTATLGIPGTPKLRTSGFPSDISLGEDTMASCFVKKGSDGPYVMTWHRNGQEVKDNARVKTSVKATGTTIAIDGIRVEDVANYTCTATNAEGSDTLTLPLVVAGELSGVFESLSFISRLFPGGPPDLREFSFPSEVALGEEILVGCFVKKGAAGPYHITWLKDGREIRESERVTITARSKTSAALRISSLRAEDVANYTCVASNDYGTDSVTAPLIINDIPKIQEFKFPANLSPGDTTHVGCIVSKGGAGPYELSWWKDGVPLTHDSSRTSVMSHKGGPVSTLTIVDVSASDSGNYTCVARNAAGSDSFSAFLAVTGVPRLQSSGFPNELSLGEETVATCFVKKGSAGPYSLAWHKEGEPVRNSDRVVVTVKSTSTALSIDGVQVEDIGNYTCSATNSAGTDALTLPLLISGETGI